MVDLAGEILAEPIITDLKKKRKCSNNDTDISKVTAANSKGLLLGTSWII